MTLRMAVRKVIVTGGASGIGRATAELFVREGARVGLIDRDKDALQQVSREAPDQLFGVAADVADADAVETAVRRIAEVFDDVDCLVNNAAVRAYGSVGETDDADWAQTWQVNVGGAVNVCRSTLPLLRRAPSASIVTVSSVYGRLGRAGMGAYDATKAALLSLTQTLAVEEAPNGIRVNAVCPGSTWTPWTAARAGGDPDTPARASAGGGLLDRWAQPEEIAYPILWLASQEASFITGQLLVVDGGLSVT